MKKYIDPVHALGLPIKGDDLVGMMQKDIYAVLYDICAGLAGDGGAMVVSGMVYSAITPGVSATISAGIVYYNGELYRYAGGVGVDITGSLIVRTNANIQRVFFDGNSYDAISNVDMIWDAGAGVIPLLDTTIDQWRLPFTKNYIPAVTFPFDATNWANPSGTNAGNQRTYIKMGMDLHVSLSGMLQGNVDTDLQSSNIVSGGVLPVIYRPLKLMRFPVLLQVSTLSNVFEMAQLTVKTNGNVIIQGTGVGRTLLNMATNGGFIQLDGVRYPSIYAKL